MSDSNRGEIIYIKESTFGTPPSGTYNVQVMPFTSEGLQLDTRFLESQIIDPTRNVKYRIRTEASVSGPITTEFFGGKDVAPTGPYGAPDDFIRSALQAGDWSAEATHSAVNMTFTAKGANPYPTITRASGSWVTDGYSVGDWVRPQGASNSSNNVPCKVMTVSATVLGVIPSNPVNTIGDLVAEGPSAGITVAKGSDVTNGTTLDTYSIQRRYNDLANTTWGQLLGAGVNGMSIRNGLNNISTISFDFIGKTAESGVFAGTPTDIAASTEEPYNVVDDVNAVMQWTSSSYASIAGVTSFNVSVGNSLRAREQFSTFGPVSLGSGTFVASADFEMYYDATAAAIWAAYRAGSEVSVAIVFDNGTRSYAIELMNAKYNAAPRPITGRNTDVYLRPSIGAFLNATEGATMRIVRW